MKHLNYQKGISPIIAVILLAIILVGGAYYFKQQTKQVSKSNIEVDETANWKTYANSEQGFEFKYPATCKTSRDSNVGGVQLSADINRANDNCNFSVVYYDNLAIDSSLSNTQKIIIQGNDALTGVFENKYISLKRKIIYVSRNGQLYEISYTLVNDKQIFKTGIPEKIISTFKFTK